MYTPIPPLATSFVADPSVYTLIHGTVNDFREYGTVYDFRELFSSHEKADTRMILHDLYSDMKLRETGKNGRFILWRSNTDVIVLCVHYFKQMINTRELWVQMGNISSVKDGRRFLPIHQLCASLSTTICTVLLAVHALTGCDTTSSFFLFFLA